MEGSKKDDTCCLYIGRDVSENVYWGVSSGLPCQCQLSRLDSILGVVVPWRTKFDVLDSSFVREYSLQAFIELLGES